MGSRYTGADKGQKNNVPRTSGGSKAPMKGGAMKGGKPGKMC